MYKYLLLLFIGATAAVMLTLMAVTLEPQRQSASTVSVQAARTDFNPAPWV